MKLGMAHNLYSEHQTFLNIVGVVSMPICLNYTSPTDNNTSGILWIFH